MHDDIHKGWHSRGYLPHLDAPGEIQALNFRLGDSVPKKVIVAWKRELLGTPGNEAEVRKRISKYEDAGYGSCLLGNPANAEIVQSCLFHADGRRYRLLEWCVMPNHVHVMIEALSGASLGQIVKEWKSYSAHEINRRLGRSGALWAEDYHDRYIRDQGHFEDARFYIRNNPVRAGLCAKAGDWPWSSAGCLR